jgi:hypothetical protein
MCFSLVALDPCGVTINDPKCTSKTFPDYFDRAKPRPRLLRAPATLFLPCVTGAPWYDAIASFSTRDTHSVRLAEISHRRQ